MKKYLIVAAVASLALAAVVYAQGSKCRVCNGTGWTGNFKCHTCGGDGVFGN